MPTRCKKCNAECWSGLDEFELCTKCQIGEGSPTLWLLERIREKLSKPVAIWNKASSERSCFMSLTYNAKTGECFGTEKPSWEDMKDYVTVGATVVCDNDVKRSNVYLNIQCWVDAGTTAIRAPKALTITDFQNLVAEGAPYLTVAIADTITYVKENLYFCVECENDFPKPFAGKHFAGSYCSVCWEKYKRKNSRVCSKCRRPQWDCCC